jgi:hypothetical protein
VSNQYTLRKQLAAISRKLDEQEASASAIRPPDPAAKGRLLLKNWLEDFHHYELIREALTKDGAEGLSDEAVAEGIKPAWGIKWGISWGITAEEVRDFREQWSPERDERLTEIKEKILRALGRTEEPQPAGVTEASAASLLDVREPKSFVQAAEDFVAKQRKEPALEPLPPAIKKIRREEDPKSFLKRELPVDRVLPMSRRVRRAYTDMSRGWRILPISPF